MFNYLYLKLNCEQNKSSIQTSKINIKSQKKLDVVVAKGHILNDSKHFFVMSLYTSCILLLLAKHYNIKAGETDIKKFIFGSTDS